MKPVVCCANCEYVFPECGAKNMGCDKFSPNWRNRPAPDKTGFEEWYQKYCDESELIEDRIVDIRAAWNAALLEMAKKTIRARLMGEHKKI